VGFQSCRGPRQDWNPTPHSPPRNAIRGLDVFVWRPAGAYLILSPTIPLQCREGEDMKTLRVLLAVAVLGGMATLAYVGQRGEPAGGKMVLAAQRFLDSLSSDDQRKTAMYDFDSKERTNWHFVPLQAKMRRP